MREQTSQGVLLASWCVAFLVLCVVLAPCVLAGVCLHIVPRRSICIKKAKAEGAVSDALASVVTRQSVMSACHYVVDIMFEPVFWASINSKRMQTLESVIPEANAFPQAEVTLYIPLPILNVSHQTLLAGLTSEKRVTLVSNTGDETMLPTVFADLVFDQRIATIRVNNVPLTFRGHPKVQLVPIGICQDEYYYKPFLLAKQDFLLRVTLKKLPCVSLFIKNHPCINVLDVVPKRRLLEKQVKVMCAISNTGSQWTVPDLRRRCKQYLTEASFGHVLPFMSKARYFEEHENCAFEISPFGNGLDCFRTYEALCLHTIPIVFDSPINSIFHGLPVVIVKEVTEITNELLQAALQQYGTYFETHRIREELAVQRWWQGK